MHGAVGADLVTLLQEIKRCIRRGGDVAPGASEFLQLVRAERAANRQALDKIIKSTAVYAFQKNLSDIKEGSMQMGRQCISVKRGRQGELPTSGVTLATSNTGATLYVEPTDAIPLNNEEMKLATAEREEEQVIMIALSRAIHACTGSLLRLLDCAVQLDLACARAKHAAWLGAAKPVLRRINNLEGRPHQIELPGLRHPLLLEPSLGELPQPPLIGDAVAAFNSRFLGRADSAPTPLTFEPAQKAAHKVKPPPQAIDMQVPAQLSVVAVTGPNTGGKTASLKALGLACVMAKAGMYMPVETQAQNAPVVAWYDQVLADLGDGQSLQQSLSTFSGHIRRVQRALEAATEQSLVLLDELGSGTDPAEGAALACVLLEELAHRAALTYVTSHFYEVKELASERSDFTNAAVEFDLATLTPTYRLLWNERGASNALNVATRLGFDPAVVSDARATLEELGLGGHGGQERAAELASSLEDQLQEAAREADLARKRREELEAQAAALEARMQELRGRAAEGKRKSDSFGTKMKKLAAEADDLVERHRKGKATRQDALAKVAEIQAMVPDTSSATAMLIGLRSRSLDEEDEEADWLGMLADDADDVRDEDWLPKAGERVVVHKMGGSEGQVVTASKRKGGSITVKVGALTVEMRVMDVSPISKARRKRLQASVAAQTRQSGSAKRVAAGAADAPPQRAAVVAIQTNQNTVDVRGQSASDAVLDVDAAMGRLGSHRALFVIHGVGTGVVRKAVLERFRNHPMVDRIEAEEGSMGGCSIFYIK